MTGPGDEILDAIESGISDAELQKKYKIDSAQLGAFKSLHYGLSNKKMQYEEIGDYYPELNSYFKPSTPAPQNQQQATVIERPDFTKPVSEKKVAESTAPSTLQSKQLAEQKRNPETTAQLFAEKVKKSNQTALKTLVENDDVIVKLIREGRYMQEQEKRLNEFAAGPRTDMPAAQALADQRLRMFEPETKPQDLPIADEEVVQKKADIQKDEQQARWFLREVAERKPDKAKDIESSIYMLDATERLKADPEKGNRVYENLRKIENGDLRYDPATGTVVRPEGFWDALVTGVRSRTDMMQDYEKFQGPKEEVIKLMEDRLKSYDPDEPVPRSEGAASIGQMAGSEWKTLLTGGAIGAVTSLTGTEPLAPAINAALAAPEYYKRGFASAFSQAYRQLRAEGKEPEIAYDKAIEQANSEAKYDAAEGVISTAIGARIGLKPVPKFNITGGFKKAAGKLLSNATHYGGEVGLEGGIDALVAGALQDQKNRVAQENDIFRTTGEGLKEAMEGEFTFALAVGAVTGLGKAAVDGKTVNKLLYHLARQPKEAVDAKIGEMVMEGQLPEAEAKEALLKIEEQRKIEQTIPDDIKEVSRQAMAEKIQRRNELEKELESKDKALHPPIKEEIKKLNEEILEHSKHVRPEEDQVEEAEASAAPDEAPAIDQAATPGADVTIGSEGSVPGVQQTAEPDVLQEQGTAETLAPPTSDQQLAVSDESVGATNEGFSGAEATVSKEKQAFYDNAAGGAPNLNTGRIPVDPIVGGNAKRLSKIISDVSKGLKQRLAYAKPGRSAIGVYMPGFKGIKIRYNGDLDTTAHELGHSIDDQFDIYTEAAKDPDVLAEWEALAQHGGSQPPKGHPDPVRYIQKEGFAEWLRGFMVNPQAAQLAAPNTYALYQALVNQKFQNVLIDFSNDIRAWAGSEGKDITMANVEFEPEKPKGLLGQLFKKEQTNNEFSIGWWDKVAANFINPLQAFEKGFKYAKGIQGDPDVLPENDPIILSRILLGIDGKFGEVLKTGMIDGKGEVLTSANGNPMTLKWLLEPFDNSDQASIEQDMRDAIAYMISERVVNDLSQNLQRGDVITGAGGGVYSDFAVAQKTLNEFHGGDPKRLERIQEAGNRYRDFAKATMQYAVDKGRMSQDTFDAIVDRNEYYVAMQRIIETQPGEEITMPKRGTGKTLGSKADIIHSLKGSTKEIKNPYVSLLDNLYKTLRESDRNDVLRAFTDMLVNPRSSNQGDVKRISDIGIKGSDGDKEVITVFKNGKAEKWLFQRDLHNALKGLDKEAYRLPGLFTAPARFLRAATTQFPTFAVRNWIRDTQDRLIKTTTGSSLKDFAGKKEDWAALARAGGLNSGHYLKDRAHYYGLLGEAMQDMAKDKKFILADPDRLKYVWHKYQDLLYRGETSNRVAEYRGAFRDAKKKGMDDYNAGIYAAYKSRDLIDFAIMGHWMKIINQVVPFSNAAIQGLRSGAVSVKHDWKGFLARMTVYSIAPGMAAWFWNHRNEEDAEKYEEQPSYVRDMFWNFRVGPDKWLSIPKPYELSLTAAGVDRAMSYTLGGNEKAFDGYAGSVRDLLFPFDEGNIAGAWQTIIEGYANYDFFRKRHIIPPDEDPLNLALRHTETASRLGMLLQNATDAIGFGVDARKIDHFIKRQFSYTGGFVIKMSDIGKKDSRHEFDLTDTGLFKRTPAYSSVSVQKMISYAKEWGLNRTPAYKGFNQTVGDYFDAKSGEEREAIADEMIEYAKGLLEAWKQADMEEKQVGRADAKKEARKK